MEIVLLAVVQTTSWWQFAKEKSGGTVQNVHEGGCSC